MAKDKRFKSEPPKAEGSVLTHVIIDTETGVQYLLAISPNLGSGMSVMLDADGKPFLAKQV